MKIKEDMKTLTLQKDENEENYKLQIQELQL